MKRLLTTFLLIVAVPAISEIQQDPAPAPSSALAQLRHIAGNWRVQTRFRQQDGSETKPFAGTYRFEWVIPDALLRGVSEIPELGQRSAIMFYHRPVKGEIEMVSVGADGKLWVMTGRDGSESRETTDLPTTDGGTMRLRFTRFNVTPDRFESRMEWSTDKGASWTTGNHQVFARCPAEGAC
jgi:hypothetical protein